jgi:hypothetical protein
MDNMDEGDLTICSSMMVYTKSTRPSTFHLRSSRTVPNLNHKSTP